MENSKYTYSININGNMLVFRTDDFEELKSTLPDLKEFAINEGNDIRVKNNQLMLSSPSSAPDNIKKPEGCKACKSTNMIYVTGITKQGNVFHAFDCLDCTDSLNGSTVPTRNFVNPTIEVKSAGDKKPVAKPKKSTEPVNCPKCNKEVPESVIKYCNDKNLEILCFDCQQLKKKGK